ncbi:uncharacterized protein Tco025E_06202 [Trypanosoma conorhini]|uniref:UPF3 domain-containing protein n=1 Tax=Trypanosoma conorhini TaxID=83891 RepID=A0A3R7N640_9TRYP|nr:uncharacterized protein Tco025E_06202 [Trypanosoma conorhini]RNF13404.1 hypothetical protein Tco025E_06202 [Trypanosoma conorhini]
MSCSSRMRAPRQPRQQHPLCLFIRRLPHDITHVKLKAVLRERGGCGEVEDVVDLYVLRGFARHGDRPYVPSTAVVSLRPAQDGDDNATKRVAQAIKDIFDGRVVFDEDDDAPDAMASTVEWAPACFNVFPPLRRGSSGKKRGKPAAVEWRPGTIEDDEHYKRFCAGLDKPSSEASEDQTEELGGEPKVEAAPRSLLVQGLLAECGHLKKVKATGTRRKRKEEAAAKAAGMTKSKAKTKPTKKVRKEVAQPEKRTVLRNPLRESAREERATVAPKNSKTERKKLRAPRILRPEGGGDALVEAGCPGFEPKKARRQKQRPETKKERLRRRKPRGKEEPAAVEASPDRGKVNARRSRRVKNRRKTDGEKGIEPPGAEALEREEAEGKGRSQEQSKNGGREREENEQQKARGKRKRDRRSKNRAREKEKHKKAAASPASIEVDAEDKGKGVALPRGPHVDPSGERELEQHSGPTAVPARGSPPDPRAGEGGGGGGGRGGKASRRERGRKRPSDQGTKQTPQVRTLLKRSDEAIVVSSSDRH